MKLEAQANMSMSMSLRLTCLLGSSQTGPQNITWKPMDLRAMGVLWSWCLVSLRLSFPTWKMKL